MELGQLKGFNIIVHPFIEDDQAIKMGRDILISQKAYDALFPLKWYKRLWKWIKKKWTIITDKVNNFMFY